MSGPGAASASPPRPRGTAPRPLEALARRLPGVVAHGALDDVSVTGVTHDSRAVRPGDLYAALPGARVHGARFAAQVAAAGAVAVLTDPAGVGPALAAGLPALAVPAPRGVLGATAAWIYGEPSARLRLLGVTGTNGKTTTAYLLEAGLRAAGERTGLIGTVETRIAGETVPSVRTTPESTDLQALLAVMHERAVDAVAMEVSSHALAMGRVDGCRFRLAAFTNLSQDHLDFHGSLEAYYAAKASLFVAERTAGAVVNVDDAHGRRLAAHTTVPCLTFSPSGGPADWRAEGVDVAPDGSRFRAVGPRGQEVPVTVRLPGAFNVANALAAVAMLVETGTPPEAAAAGIGALAGVPGRMERVDAGQPFLAVVDYAHTPEAVATLLATLRTVTTGRLVVVLGCGGDRDRGKRPLMGAAAAAGADLAIFTNDNPRSEDPHDILDAMLTGARRVPAGRRAGVSVVPDRAEAIALAVSRAHPGDAVVVAGKGHETGQEQDGAVTPFDDRVVLAAALTTAGSAS